LALAYNLQNILAMSILDRFVDNTPALRCSSLEAVGRIIKKHLLKTLDSAIVLWKSFMNFRMTREKFFQGNIPQQKAAFTT